MRSINLKRSSFYIFITVAMLLGGFLNPKQAEAKTKTAHVDIESGVLNIRSGPGKNYKVIGTLKNKEKITIYSGSNGTWAETMHKNKKGYVTNEYLRYYRTMSRNEAKKISEKVYNTQLKIKENRYYTKAQIKKTLSGTFTSSYINNLIEYEMSSYGRDSRGNILYAWDYDYPIYYVLPVFWQVDYDVIRDLPSIVCFTKGGKQYARIEQSYYLDIDTLYQKLYLSRTSSKAEWKLYRRDW